MRAIISVHQGWGPIKRWDYLYVSILQSGRTFSLILIIIIPLIHFLLCPEGGCFLWKSNIPGELSGTQFLLMLVTAHILHGRTEVGQTGCQAPGRISPLGWLFLSPPWVPPVFRPLTTLTSTGRYRLPRCVHLYVLTCRTPTLHPGFWTLSWIKADLREWRGERTGAVHRVSEGSRFSTRLTS